MSTPEKYIKHIRRKTRRVFTPEEIILIVMKALRAETSMEEICRNHGIQKSTLYKWNTEFIEACKKQLSENTAREATSEEIPTSGRKPNGQGNRGRPFDAVAHHKKSLDNLR